MTAAQVEVPAGIYNESSRVSEEARLTTVTIGDDVERVAAWRLIERPGLKGVASPNWVTAQIWALMQSAGVGRNHRHRASGRRHTQ